jgi:hypothetical protein
MFHSILGKKKLSKKKLAFSQRSVTFFQKKKNKKSTLYVVFTIKFLCGRKCLKLGYDFKTLLLSAE